MANSEGILNLYAEKCNKLLEESEIRFAGIVDKDGELISGGFKEGIAPYEGDETRLQSFLEFVSKASIRKEYDESFRSNQLSGCKTRQSRTCQFPISYLSNPITDFSRAPLPTLKIWLKK